LHDRPLPTALKNIETIARLEQQFLEERSLIDRIADAVGSFVGTMAFVALHVVLFVSWISINAGFVPGIQPFDRFPFMFLSMSVSLEGVLLTTFVLMKQNRMSKRSEQRNQLNLQVDMLSEREITKILQMVSRIGHHLGLEEMAEEEEIRQMSEHTAVDLLAKELKDKIPD
jgi:uncharacterized membrane protein